MANNSEEKRLVCSIITYVTNFVNVTVITKDTLVIINLIITWVLIM